MADVPRSASAFDTCILTHRLPTPPAVILLRQYTDFYCAIAFEPSYAPRSLLVPIT